jgi:hypothetical protein
VKTSRERRNALLVQSFQDGDFGELQIEFDGFAVAFV